MFTIQFSNKVEMLCDRLMAGMATPLADPLTPEYVLVDNAVMGQWLNLQLAQKQGIAANIHYIRPHELFWTLARAVVSKDIPKETPLSKDEMAWRLYGLLNDDSLLTAPDMLPVANYLQGDDSKALKRFQLAAAIADLFDQYLVYRPEWMLRWEDSADRIADANAAWQRVLWKKLTESSLKKNVDGLHHRAIIEKQLLENLAKEKVQAAIPLQRLFVFGIASMPPHLVNMLMLLGKHIDVQLYVMNPCQEYWSLIQGARSLAKQTSDGEIDDGYYEIGNPLLASQGVQVRDFINLLQDVTDDCEDHFAGTDEPQSLLQAIQQEILTLNYKGESARVDYVSEGCKQILPAADANSAEKIPSVHIHNCHSVMREVEVLHDQLRDILHRHPDIHPRDIVVMMPRVAPYVASIHAVFNSVPEKYRIDYQITDRTQAEESPLLNSLAILMTLPESRLPLSEVLSLLEVPAIQRCFGIDQDNYETIKRWLVDAGVHWGADAAHRQETGLPAYAEASWAFGFDRLLSGYAMAADATSVDSIVQLANGYGVLPYDEVEGGNSHCLNALLQFWQTLQYWRGVLNKPATPHSWAERLRSMVEDFFDPADDKELAATRTIYNAIRTLDTAEEQGWFMDEITLSVIRHLMQPELDKSVPDHHQWREGVKFCSLMPMRGVPFKVVYVLGMNLEDYPRRIDRRSFDLMRNDHRPGDRASRVDDRWLFLEALLSARQFFHVSYIGRDMHRNEKREPSVVLSELLDYCRHGYELPENYLVTAHPLQPFGTDYFSKDRSGLSSRLVSFNDDARLIAAARQQKPDEQLTGESRWAVEEIVTPADELITVSIEDFIKFFTRPWDWFFTRKHKVWLEIENDAVNDDENFGDSDTNALDNWNDYKDLIVMANALPDAPDAPETIRDQLVDRLATLRTAEGRWPLGKAGHDKQESLKEIKPDYLFASYGKPVHHRSIKIQIGKGSSKIVVSGELPVTDDGALLIHSASRLGSDKRLDVDIKLALARQLPAKELIVAEGLLVFRDKSLHVPLSAIDATLNTAFLDMLAAMFMQYRQSGLPFDLALSEKLCGLNDIEERDAEMESQWYEKSDYKTGIAFDIKKRSYFGHINAIKCEKFQSVGEEIITSLYAWRAPVDECIETVKKEKKEAAKKSGKKS